MISTKAWCAAAAAALAASLAAPAMAVPGPMVVRAAGPSAADYRPGTRLAADQAIALRAGDSLVILDARGTRSLQGPGSFRFDQAPAAERGAVMAFASLLNQKTERRARIGAVRGAAPSATLMPRPPGVWAIDSGSSGTVCVLDPTQVSLWRRDAATAQHLTVTRTSDAKTASLDFEAGQSVAPWPAALAPATPAKYAVSGAAAPVALTIKTLPAPPASIDELGAALFENGCQAQLDRLTTLTATTAGD